MSFDGPVPGVPGAIIREVATLPDHLPNGRTIGPHTEAAPGALLFSVPSIGRFLVRQGNTIEVVVETDAARAAAKLIVDGTARGALIHQRGELALDAAALVSPSGSGVAIAGSSGTGKSTLATALNRRGWQLLSDGVARVTWNGRCGLVWPADKRLRLWRDACESLGLNPDALEPVRPGVDQYYVLAEPASAPAPLEIVVRLRVCPACAIVEVPAVQWAESLSQCTLRPRQVIGLGQGDEHARIVSQLSRTCRVLVLEGARENPVDELADRLSAAIA